MQTLTINIANDTLADKVMWLLEHFKNDGLEIVSKEEIEDLKLFITGLALNIHYIYAMNF